MTGNPSGQGNAPRSSRRPHGSGGEIRLSLSDLYDYDHTIYEPHPFEHLQSPEYKGMETAIRWDQQASQDNCRFLLADVKGHTFKHCEVTGLEGDRIIWREISHNSKAPAFRAYDWSYKRSLVAVGQWSGETTVLGLRNDSPSLSLPVKSQRQCNAVAFNSDTLLGTGLEKIRNDFCLNVYDLQQWASSSSTGLQSGKQTVDPLRKLATSEGIMSLKFFQDHPNVLVAGVKSTCVRIYDLREHTGNPVLSYATGCVHNIAVDPCDSNYFASAGSVRDTTVTIWDKRAAAHSSTARSSTSGSEGPILELKNVFGEPQFADLPSIWSLRYSVTESGCLGILGSMGNFRLFWTKKEYYTPDKKPEQRGSKVIPRAEQLYVDESKTIGIPTPINSRGTTKASSTQSEIEQIRAFDFMNVGSQDGKHQLLLLRGNQELEVYKTQRQRSALAISVRNQVFLSKPVGSSSKAHPRAGYRLFSARAPDQDSISESLQRLQILFGQQANISSDTTASTATREPSDDGWNDGSETSPVKPKPTSSATLSGLSKPKGTIEDALLLADVPYRRAIEGYLFDPKKNQDIIKDDKALLQMWAWLEYAIENVINESLRSDQVDFSYLGIFNIWNAQLSTIPEKRVLPGIENPNVADSIQQLSEKLGITDIEVTPKTTKANYRRLCLHALGFKARPLETVKAMTVAGHGPEAILHAVIMDDLSAAIVACRSGPKHLRNRALGAILYRYELGDPDEEILRQVEATLVDEQNIYAKATIACIVDLFWDETTKSPELPARYRIALPLKFNSDPVLTDLISSNTQSAISEGDISQIFYTGLSEDSLGLFVKYVERTWDIQSTSLALGLAVPRFWSYPRVTHWRETYRRNLNERKLYIERSLFDQQSSMLSRLFDGTPALPGPARQFTLSCINCENPLSWQDIQNAHQHGIEQEQRPAAQGAAGQSISQSSRVLGSDGTMCPRCGARLPRCAICDHWTGVVDPHGAGDTGAEGEDDSFKDHLELCLTCEHYYHHGCAEEWFVTMGKNVCPAEGCECPCDSL